MNEDPAIAVTCRHCGTKLEVGARFCGSCGRPIGAPPPSQQPAPSPSAENVADTLIDNRPPGGAAIAGVSRVIPRKSEVVGSRDGMVGRTLNRRYVVGDKIGEGGFGAVFRGKQLATGRDVALKILHAYNLKDETIVARFRREAEACSRLRSPHTVTTYDFDETEDGVLYLAMELLEGRSLHHLQRTVGVLPPARALGILDQVAQALTEAHEQGVIHRDMKPENVFVETREGDDYVKVLDFGIAKIISDDRQKALTAVGQTLGTIEFMSPEQLRGLALDGRSDIYALGMMAYEMLTGQLPFQAAKSATQIINFHMNEAPPVPSKLRPDGGIPASVDAIVLKMAAKSRDARYHDAGQLRGDIARALRELGAKGGQGGTADVIHLDDVDNAAAAPGADRYRVAGVFAAAFLLVSAVVYFLTR